MVERRASVRKRSRSERMTSRRPRAKVKERRASVRKRIRSEIMTRGDQIKRQAKRQHKVYTAIKC